MDCSSVDIKAYALGEPAAVADAAHVEACPNCREELERLRLTQAALLSLAEEEVPQRIAFVSDKIFEPRWWQRMWHSGPAMGFASASVLAAAILVHASTRPPQVVAAPVNTAQIEQRIHAEVTKRLDAEVGKAVARVVAESEARQQRSAAMLAAAEKRFQAQRQEDIAMIEQTGRYYQSKLGQLMVASNNYAGGAR
jgi:hypothetical protein